MPRQIGDRLVGPDHDLDNIRGEIVERDELPGDLDLARAGFKPQTRPGADPRLAGDDNMIFMRADNIQTSGDQLDKAILMECQSSLGSGFHHADPDRDGSAFVMDSDFNLAAHASCYRCGTAQGRCLCQVGKGPGREFRG